MTSCYVNRALWLATLCTLCERITPSQTFACICVCRVSMRMLPLYVYVNSIRLECQMLYHGMIVCVHRAHVFVLVLVCFVFYIAQQLSIDNRVARKTSYSLLLCVPNDIHVVIWLALLVLKRVLPCFQCTHSFLLTSSSLLACVRCIRHLYNDDDGKSNNQRQKLYERAHTQRTNPEHFCIYVLVNWLDLGIKPYERQINWIRSQKNTPCFELNFSIDLLRSLFSSRFVLPACMCLLFHRVESMNEFNEQCFVCTVGACRYTSVRTVAMCIVVTGYDRKWEANFRFTCYF